MVTVVPHLHWAQCFKSSQLCTRSTNSSSSQLKKLDCAHFLFTYTGTCLNDNISITDNHHLRWLVMSSFSHKKSLLSCSKKSELGKMIVAQMTIRRLCSFLSAFFMLLLCDCDVLLTAVGPNRLITLVSNIYCSFVPGTQKYSLITVFYS